MNSQFYKEVYKYNETQISTQIKKKKNNVLFTIINIAIMISMKRSRVTEDHIMNTITNVLNETQDEDGNITYRELEDTIQFINETMDSNDLNNLIKKGLKIYKRKIEPLLNIVK